MAQVVPVFRSIGNAINRTWINSRKHIIEGTNQALKRLQLDYVDIIYSHVFDPQTTIEEVCRGFNQVIEDGKAFYWATSNWSAVKSISQILDSSSRGYQPLRLAGTSPPRR
jgi:aryl-alcohol dehydrogenase-like predicted oxidoreductase